MGWRHIMISNMAKISTKNNQLVITQDSLIPIPLEDIASIVIENNESIITTSALSKISDYNIPLYTCDDKHLPNGVFNSFNKHSRQLSILKMQLGLSKPFQKRIWQKNVIQKLLNQSKCLSILNKKGEKELINISRTVESGDKTNREAYGAKIYFSNLFDYKFKRQSEDTINAALNYGYAILRGAVARTLVSYGFHPAIGINHHSELNRFNLADDFIETLRPIVDLHTEKNVDYEDEFNTSIKRGLYNLLNYNVLIDNAKHSVNNAIEIMIKSFVTSCKEEDYNKLKLPELIPLELHEYE